MSNSKLKKISNLADITLHDKNANKGTERGQALIEKSFADYGAGRSILIDRNGKVIAGNKSFNAANKSQLDNLIVVQTDGSQLVAVQRTDLDLDIDSKAKALAIADNRTNELNLTWDFGVLDELNKEIDLSSFWQSDELSALLNQTKDLLQPGKGGDDFDTSPNEGETICQLGDIWQLGKHRLLCGDCTDKFQVEKLMDGEIAEMLFTDPPYGVNYTGGHFHSGNVNIKRDREKLEGDNNSDLYSKFLPIILPFIDGPCYMWFTDKAIKPVYDAVINNNCEIHALIIWHKINATYAAMNAQYKQRHEPLLYFKPKGSTLRWCGPTDECTLWEIKRDGVNEFHPTQKPIALAMRAISNHEVKSVLDCFAGSGSTLIASQRCNKISYNMEISPAYCDVIIARYEAETGQKAIRAN